MKTISLKLDEATAEKLVEAARRKSTTKSDVVREAIATYFEASSKDSFGSCLDLAGDLIGSVDGPNDLSFNPLHMDDFGQ